MEVLALCQAVYLALQMLHLTYWVTSFHYLMDRAVFIVRVIKVNAVEKGKQCMDKK